MTVTLRPSFEALVRAEGELGSLFALIERASEGRLLLSEIVALFDHLSGGRPDGMTRATIGQAVIDKGMTNITPIIRRLFGQILRGRE